MKSVVRYIQALSRQGRFGVRSQLLGLGVLVPVLAGGIVTVRSAREGTPASPTVYELGLESTDRLNARGAYPAEIAVRERGGTYRARLTDDPAMLYHAAALSQDLTRLAFAGERLAPDGTTAEKGLYVANIHRRRDGRPRRAAPPFLSLPLDNVLIHDLTLCWLGDSRRIVFSVSMPVGGNRYQHDLWMADIETGDQKRITGTPVASEIFPAYSAAADRIVFTRQPGDDRHRLDIYTCATDGSGLRRVTTPANSPDTHNVYPEWNADGKDILFHIRGIRHSIRSDGSAPAVEIQGR